MNDLERKPIATSAKERVVRFLASIGLGDVNRGDSPLPSNLLLEGELPKIEVPVGLGERVVGKY